MKVPLLRRLIALIGAFAFAGVGLAQTTITVRSSARLESGAQEVRLRDVAEVSPVGSELEDLVVLTGLAADTGRDWIRIDLASIRAALDAAGVNWGKVSLHGGDCTLRLTEPRLATRSDGTRGNPRGLATPTNVDLSGLATLRTAIATRLAALYGVDPDRLRLGFDPADEPALGTLVSNRTVEIQPGGLESSSRLPVAVTLYDGDRVVLSRTVPVDALVYRPTLTASTTIERGRTITQDMVKSVEQWVSPGPRSPAETSSVIGAVSQGRIQAGEIIAAADIAPPLACKRGDTVYIHCLSGSIVVKVKGRALGSARDGELVQVKCESSDDPITARMSGRGRAVMVVQSDIPAPPPSVHPTAGRNGS